MYVPEEELLRLRVGDRVEVVPDRFPDARTTGDIQFISPAVDPASAEYVEGAEIDYVDSLMGKGFTINNPNAQSTCACGDSFH